MWLCDECSRGFFIYLLQRSSMDDLRFTTSWPKIVEAYFFYWHSSVSRVSLNPPLFHAFLLFPLSFSLSFCPSSSSHSPCPLLRSFLSSSPISSPTRLSIGLLFHLSAALVQGTKLPLFIDSIDTTCHESDKFDAALIGSLCWLTSLSRAIRIIGSSS